MEMFNDSHLEVKKLFKDTFFIHPYETSQADEAIFFVMVKKIEGNPVFESRVQLSRDGIHWADDGSKPVVFKGLGQHVIEVSSNFGDYIRLAASIEGGEILLNLHIACEG